MIKYGIDNSEIKESSLKEEDLKKKKKKQKVQAPQKLLHLKKIK